MGSLLRETDLNKKQTDSDFIKSLPSQPGKEFEIQKRLDKLRDLKRINSDSKNNRNDNNDNNNNGSLFPPGVLPPGLEPSSWTRGLSLSPPPPNIFSPSSEE